MGSIPICSEFWLNIVLCGRRCWPRKGDVTHFLNRLTHFSLHRWFDTHLIILNSPNFQYFICRCKMGRCHSTANAYFRLKFDAGLGFVHRHIIVIVIICIWISITQKLQWLSKWQRNVNILKCKRKYSKLSLCAKKYDNSAHMIQGCRTASFMCLPILQSIFVQKSIIF